MKILSFGEILWDVYPTEKYIGGAPLNFAAHFVKHGGEAYMLSALGADELGKSALSKLKGWNINTEYVSVLKDKETGKCLVTIDEKGIPSYNLLKDVAYDYVDCNLKNKEFDALYFGTLAQRSENNFKGLKEILKNNRFGDVFVDINIRPPFYSKETILFSFENATIMKISEEELGIITNILFGEEYNYKIASKKISQRFENLKFVIITKGGDGCYLYNSKTGEEYSKEAFKVKVVSSVGAGDSFSASFMYNYLSGERIEECLNRANKIGAFVVSKAEAIPDYDF